MNALWERYRRLSKSERHDLMLGFLLIPAATVFVRLIGVPQWKARTEQDLETSPESETIDAAQLREARTTARMIEAASRYGIMGGNCLSKSIALTWRLRRKGIRADLRIGARKTGEVLEAHAWVERSGQIVNDVADVRESFAAFEVPMTSGATARK